MTTENFGYMSGASKDFFDRVYYPCLGKTEGLPYALVIRAGLDGSGAESAVKRIVTGLKWRQTQATILCKSNFEQHFIQQCKTLGMTLSASLDNHLL